MKPNPKDRAESKYPGTKGPFKEKAGSARANPDPNATNRDDKPEENEQDRMNESEHVLHR